MSSYIGLGKKLGGPVIKSLQSLKNSIIKFDNSDEDGKHDVCLDILAFRRGWRKLSTCFGMINNDINRGLALAFHENSMCIDECIMRENCFDDVLNNFESRIYPGFEAYFHKSMDKNKALSSSAIYSCASLEKLIETLMIDFERRKLMLEELELFKRECSALANEPSSIDPQKEELRKKIEPFKGSLETFTNYLDDLNGDDSRNFCSATLLDLNHNLVPIYIYFISFMDRINTVYNIGKAIGVNIDESGNVIITVNKPFLKVAATTSSAFQKFFINVFPIKMKFSMMSTLYSREIVLLSVILNGNRLVKYNIFSDILFDKDSGEIIPLIDKETMNILPRETYGQPYYWLQFFVNNIKVIPKKMGEMKINPCDLFKVIEYRINNFTIFSFILYLASIGPDEFISFILLHSGVKSINTEITQIVMGSYKFDLINEREKNSFTIKTKTKNIHVEIKLFGNMSYRIKHNDVIYKEEFSFVRNEFNMKNVNYNREITTHFCRKIVSYIEQ
ncbi:putative transmembrane domain-containing protein [Cryptosporidium canis]|uniref:Transmembrane domain-containing protein n=1 Tax=Cryptosporidium canis TaxID=195482 RepID=A0A9D5DHU9_9CRYT|nr:putative transmembrane domain-containing protein [Cryptosporidium canis]